MKTMHIIRPIIIDGDDQVWLMDHPLISKTVVHSDWSSLSFLQTYDNLLLCLWQIVEEKASWDERDKYLSFHSKRYIDPALVPDPWPIQRNHPYLFFFWWQVAETSAFCTLGPYDWKKKSYWDVSHSLPSSIFFCRWNRSDLNHFVRTEEQYNSSLRNVLSAERANFPSFSFRHSSLPSPLILSLFMLPLVNKIRFCPSLIAWLTFDCVCFALSRVRILKLQNFIASPIPELESCRSFSLPWFMTFASIFRHS